MPTTHQVQPAALGTRVLLLAGLIGACTPAAPAPSTPSPAGGAVQAGAVVRDVRANTARGSMSAPDENIATATAVNDPNAAAPEPPPSKQEAGARTRGGVPCVVHFDNRTRWFIELWVDRQPAGSMRPYGDVYVYAVPGPTRLYARAPFPNGQFISWGPSVVDCPAGGTHTARLW